MKKLIIISCILLLVGFYYFPMSFTKEIKKHEFDTIWFTHIYANPQLMDGEYQSGIGNKQYGVKVDDNKYEKVIAILDNYNYRRNIRTYSTDLRIAFPASEMQEQMLISYGDQMFIIEDNNECKINDGFYSIGFSKENGKELIDELINVLE